MFLENTCARVSTLTLKPATLLKKTRWHRCFPVNFAKFLRTSFLQNTPKWLLLLQVSINCCHFDKCHVNIYPKWNHSKGNICACECKNTRLKNQNKKEIYFISPAMKNFIFYFLFLISSDRIFRNGGLARVSTFRGGLLGKTGWLFSRGCRFYIKNKLKAQIFNDKKLNT